ncbi:MAG TPA: alanine--tRNA ligase [Candidatus Dormibacteraeota bacterium]|nr:alanine--tRNA ligase [Candidatus Dormibacteraeota bacterium]
MTAQEIRRKYLAFFKERGHRVIPRASLMPQNDPTTLFTGSGMQALIPNLMGAPHPEGKRLTNSQTCLRAQDIEEIGDNRHTTFFEMLGNWSLSDYFKQEQLPWFFEFLIDVLKLDPKRIYITCCSGFPEYGVPKDSVSAKIWQELFTQKGIEAKEVEIGSEDNGYQIGESDGRIFFYDKKNWWSRSGEPATMPIGELGGPDSEVFYRFDNIVHDPKWGQKCHPNCECGRYLELGNSVFMEYLKTKEGFEHLAKHNVDYGGGLERIAAAAIDNPDVFKISLLKPIIDKLEQISSKNYDDHKESMRVIADHLRGATFLAVDGLIPSNKEQGYVMRRLLRRAIRFGFDLGIEQALIKQVVPIVIDLYGSDFPEVAAKADQVKTVLEKEEKIFRQTLRAGIREFGKLTTNGLNGEKVFKLYDTYGFPPELSIEEATKVGLKPDPNWRQQFEAQMEDQRNRSRTATKGEFKGGLADQGEITTEYHTATHLMYRALRMVLGDQVVQRGSNITAERLRFDFSYQDKMTPKQIEEVEKIVNDQIDKDWPVSWRQENTEQALSSGVMGAFGDRYTNKVKVYTVGDPDGENFSREICGGPHVKHTAQLASGGRRFKIIKEESSSAGIRRIKAVLQ